jgi:hypothetical protein
MTYDAPKSGQAGGLDDFEAARPMTLQEWTTALAQRLGVDVDVDLRLVLDLARDAAHNVERPAAPVTTFLVGYAAAKAGGTSTDIARAAAQARALTEEIPRAEPS